VLDTLDVARRDNCKTQDLEKRWDESFAKAHGSFRSKVESAVKSTILGCGLCFYKACRSGAKTPVPKTAHLV
jgi:hypothetical protein